MENQEINLFIVNDDKFIVTALKHYLQNRFKFGVKVSTFYDGERCLKKVDKKLTL